MSTQPFMFYINTYCCILERIIYFLQHMDSTFISNRVIIYMNIDALQAVFQELICKFFSLQP